MTVVGNALGDLTLMVGELQIHATAVDIELFAEILLTHGGTLQMPSRETVAPGRRPAHYVFGLSLLPKREVGRMALFLLPVEGTCLTIRHQVFF